MPPRKPPEPDKIMEALHTSTHLGTKPIPWRDAFSVIETSFATTHIKAAQWLEPLVNGDDRPLETLTVSPHGAVTVTHRAVGRWQQHGIAACDWVSHDLSVLGYPEVDALKVYIDSTGDQISKPRRTMGKGELWVATRSVLDTYIAQAREARLAEEAERKLARAAEDALLAARNGNVADLLRGLLRGAGIDPSWRSQVDETIPKHTSRRAALNVVRLEVCNGDVRKLAAFLAALGIQPVSEDDFEPDLSNL